MLSRWLLWRGSRPDNDVRTKRWEEYHYLLRLIVVRLNCVLPHRNSNEGACVPSHRSAARTFEGFRQTLTIPPDFNGHTSPCNAKRNTMPSNPPTLYLDSASTVLQLSHTPQVSAPKALAVLIIEAINKRDWKHPVLGVLSSPTVDTINAALSCITEPRTLANCKTLILGDPSYQILITGVESTVQLSNGTVEVLLSMRHEGLSDGRHGEAINRQRWSRATGIWKVESNSVMIGLSSL